MTVIYGEHVRVLVYGESNASTNVYGRQKFVFYVEP